MKTKLLFISITILSTLTLALFITFSCSEIEEGGNNIVCNNASVINTPTELQNISLTEDYCLGQDIDLTSFPFATIGYPSTDIPDNNFTGTEFTGILNGQGYKIIGLNIDRTSASFMGIFGKIATSGTVINLTIESPVVKGNYLIGALAGENGGTIDNVKVEGTNTNVEGVIYVGGLVGINSSGSITNSSYSGDVSGTSNYTGGIAGKTDNSSITNSYAIVNINGVQYVGGLIGEAVKSPITNCYAIGTVTATDSYAGGLLGYNGDITENSYANVSVVGSTGIMVGGLAGYNFGTIKNSYAKGDVTSTGNSIGGLIGQNGKTVQNSYSTGNVSSTGSSVGGFIGYNSGSSITNCYFDTSTSGLTNGIGGGTQTAVTGITSSDILSNGDEPFSGTGGWDFNSMWSKQGLGQWPELQWQP